MITLYILFFVLSVIVYTLTAKLRKSLRIQLAVAVFLIPSVIFTILFVVGMGEAPPGFKPVTQQQLIEAAKQSEAQNMNDHTQMPPHQ